jgi:hypothetical protein
VSDSVGRRSSRPAISTSSTTPAGATAQPNVKPITLVIETSLSSVFYTCRAVAGPMMKKRGARS